MWYFPSFLEKHYKSHSPEGWPNCCSCLAWPPSSSCREKGRLDKSKRSPLPGVWAHLKTSISNNNSNNSYSNNNSSWLSTWLDIESLRRQTQFQIFRVLAWGNWLRKEAYLELRVLHHPEDLGPGLDQSGERKLLSIDSHLSLLPVVTQAPVTCFPHPDGLSSSNLRAQINPSSLTFFLSGI